jgi:hypothetical protein
MTQGGFMLRYLFILALLVGKLWAQGAQVFYTGSLSFQYAQIPFGPFSGTFAVEGSIDTTQWVPELDEGLGGLIASTEGTGAEQLLALAAKRNINPDTTYHVFGLYYRAEGPIEAGAVPNPISTVQLFLLWHLDSLAFPAELPDSLDLLEILDLIQAERKFVGAATALGIGLRDESTLDFTFSGALVDLNNSFVIVSVTNGTSHMEGLELNAVAAPPTWPLSSCITLAPNPFNPDLLLTFESELPGRLELRIHDLLGRHVETLDLGPRGPGAHVARWHARGLPGGTYVVSAWRDGILVGSQRGILIK